jgi:hypothetical protein
MRRVMAMGKVQEPRRRGRDVLEDGQMTAQGCRDCTGDDKVHRDERRD